MAKFNLISRAVAVVLAAALLAMGCTEKQKEYVKNYDPWPDVYSQIAYWMDNPAEFIDEVSPILICPEWENYVAHYDLYSKTMTEARRERCERMYEIERIGYIKVLKSFLSMNKDTLFMVMYDALNKAVIYGMVFIPASELTASKAASGLTKAMAVTIELKRVQIIAIYTLKKLEILLTRGSRAFGMKHIKINHTPEHWIALDRTAPKSKTLFLESSEDYIKDLLEKTLKSSNKIVKKEYDYITVRANVRNDYGIVREYVAVIDEETNVVITFYPADRVPEEVALNLGCYDYVRAVYGKQ